MNSPSADSRLPIADRHKRPLGSLRLSVTDRCNMRCGYCMPEEHYVWLPRESLLSFEELDRLAGIFLRLGVRKVRLTGGEPLLRHGLARLVGMLAARDLADLALTTNGILLADHAGALRHAGLQRVTVSLDTLRADRMRLFARTDRHPEVLRGIVAARDAGFRSIKLNSVIVRGFNDDEVADLLAFGRTNGLELRYIEYMDVGGATRWRREAVVTRAELLETIRRRFGTPEPVPDPSDPHAPAERFRLPDGTCFGIIASVTAPFCGSCDRSRVTADGTWFTCLYAERGIDLRDPLRMGADDDAIAALIETTWTARSDRGAENRLRLLERGVLYQVEGLRQDPRREMHTRGG